MKGSILILILSIIIFSKIFGQSSATPSIRVIGKCFGDSIILRWAPDNASAWHQLNKYGYKIERYTIIRDSSILEPKPMKLLNDAPLQPAPEKEWKVWMEKDNATAIAAQAIFGESFEVTSGKKTSVVDLINKSKEFESRHSFALFAADVSPVAANLAGLRWVDKDIKANERYLYRVYSLVPENILKISFGFVFINAKERLQLFPPRKPSVSSKEYRVLLSFDGTPLKSSYTAYQFERSDDGNVFKILNNLPIISTSPKAGSDGLIQITDTLPSLNTPFYYRMRAITPYGVWGPYSDTTKIIATSTSNSHASVTQAIIYPQNIIHIEWEYPKQDIQKLRGFELERAKSAQGPYQIITPKTLSPQTTEFQDTKPLPTNYYRVIARDLSGIESRSFPYLVQLQDSIPPNPPTAVKIKMDTVGHIQLTWDANAEPDLRGYHVYRSNFKKAEFSRVTTKILSEPLFYDTINLNTLTEKIYYKVAASDNRNNQSLFSSTVQLIKPDKNPPIAPAITSILLDSGKVKINWLNSSRDLKFNYIYRMKKSIPKWMLVKRLDGDDKQCVDVPPHEATYRYKIIAEDSALNKSTSREVEIGFRVNKNYPPVKLINATADREKKIIRITWAYKQPDVSKFLIYREIAGAGLSLYKSVVPPVADFVDESPAINTTYIYRVKAVFKNGSESGFSNEVKVNF